MMRAGNNILVFLNVQCVNVDFRFSTWYFISIIFYCSAITMPGGQNLHKRPFLRPKNNNHFFLLFIGGIDSSRDFLDVLMFLRAGVFLRPVHSAGDKRKIIGWDRRTPPRKKKIRNHSNINHCVMNIGKKMTKKIRQKLEGRVFRHDFWLFEFRTGPLI